MCHIIAETGLSPSSLLELSDDQIGTMVSYLNWRNIQKNRRR